jgi:F-type H+-transporting ATPase subunit delta
MRGASRAALAESVARFDAVTRDLDANGLARLSDELFAVLHVIDSEHMLRRSLSDPSRPGEAKADVARVLFEGKISSEALQIVGHTVAQRWSRPSELADGVEQLAVLAEVGRCEREGHLDDLEDELFRFGRILDAEPELQTALGDRSASAERRQELLDTLVADRVRPATRRLLDRAVGAPRGRSLERTIEDLCDQAAARRDRSVARVRSAVPLSDDEQERLIAALARIYRRDVVLQIDVDPSVLGGLLVRVGDDVIDGTILHRIDEVRRDLTG